MKKWLCLVLAGILSLTAIGCMNQIFPSSTDSDDYYISQPTTFSNAKSAYQYQLDEIRKINTSEELADYWRYFYKDIDGNGIEDLCVTQEHTLLMIYTFSKNKLIEIGKYNFSTATTNYYFSENKNYPGLFIRNWGGNAERYYYLTIKNNQITLERLWERYDPEGTITEYTSDNEMIKESNSICQQEKEISFLEFD